MAAPPRVLCLHGHLQAGSIFQERLAKLRRSAAGLDCVFVDGPAEAVNEQGDALRGWRQEGAASDWEAAEQALREAWQELGPFDGVLGFSEGAQAAHLFCRLHCSPDAAPALFGLRFAIFAGGLPCKAKAAAVAKPLPLPSLHFVSVADPVVSAADSRQLAAAFAGAHIVGHADGHVFPQRKEQLDAVAAFLRGLPPKEPVLEVPAGSFPCEEEQCEELEALQAMLCEEGELRRLGEGWPLRLRLRFAEEAFLDVLLPPGYPQSCRCVLALHTQRLDVQARGAELLQHLDANHEPLGAPSVFSLATAAREWAEGALAAAPPEPGGGGGGSGAGGREEAGEASEDEEEADEQGWWLQEEVDEALFEEAERAAARAPRSPAARVAGAAGYGRPWQYTVGLVGKPSAGKSTFFNAACQLGPDRAAPMAAHPFTTIEPNVSPGWFAAPCPSEGMGLEAAPEYGVAPGGRRRLPLLVKDVAGLVPGAYQGQGRGNAFLNDLVDADALVHVVDASGRTDSRGVDQGEAGRGAGDPLGDIGWVRRELHLWVFSNARSKWHSVRRRARTVGHESREAVLERLAGLFSGYQITRAMVLEGLAAAGLPPHDAVDPARGVLAWTEGQLHRLVACLLRMRFPIVVALNKADHPDAAAHIERVRAAGVAEACVPCSALAELRLLRWRDAGHVEYAEGRATASTRPGAPEEVAAQLETLQGSVLAPLGSTGVLEAISAAVELRAPIFVCPVADFASCEGLCSPGRPKGVLCTSIVLRPQSTVEEAFSALKASELLGGELVRAELLLSRSPSLQQRVAKKEERLASGPQILRVVASKKPAWQKQHK